jgi:hypothetical protein
VADRGRSGSLRRAVVVPERAKLCPAGAESRMPARFQVP